MLKWLETVLLIQVIKAESPWVDGESKRETTGEIRVTNGAPWGKWTDPLFCPNETFAVGYRMNASVLLIINFVCNKSFSQGFHS